MKQPIITTMLLLATTLLLLLAGGGILPWTVWIGACLLLLPSIGSLRRPTTHTDVPTSPSPITLPFLLTTAYLLLVLLPVPLYLSLLGGIPRFEENQLVADILTAIRKANLLDPPPDAPWFALTRNRAGTLRILLYSVLCFTGYRAAQRARPHTRLLLWTLASLIAATAIAGILGRWVWPQGDTLWWYMRISHGLPGPMAGFVNPNHYAGFLALGIAISAALLADALARRQSRPACSALALLIITGGGVLLSLSRGGLLASAGALATVTLFGYRRLSRAARIGLLLPPILLAAGLAVTVTLNPTVRNRLAELRAPTESASGQDRIAAWRDSLGICARYPVFGAGPNAYRTTYPMHRTHSDEQAYRTFAENEYIQLACDTGLIGILLAALTLFLLIRPLTPEAEIEAPRRAAQLAAYGALAAAAIHACFEFVLHLPLYQLVLLTLLALATHTPHPFTNTAQTRRAQLSVLLAIALLLALSYASFSRTTRRDRLGFISAMDAHELTQFLPWAPTEAHLWTRLGQRLPHGPDAPKLRLACIEQAAAYDPLSASLQIKLAQARFRAGDHTGAADAIQRARKIRPWLSIPRELRTLTTQKSAAP